MQPRKLFLIILGTLIISALAAGCTPEGPCEVTGNESLTIYRLPDPASDVFVPSQQAGPMRSWPTLQAVLSDLIRVSPRPATLVWPATVGYS